MKSSKISGLILSAAVIVTMVGCGTNGDPGKKYDGVKAGANQSVTPSKPIDNTPPAPPAPPAQQNWDCNNPVDITLDKDAGKGVMLFNAGEEATFSGKIISKVGSDFKVDLDSSKLNADLNNDVHAGRAKFQSKASGTIATFSFTWKPGASAKLDLKTLPIRFTPNNNAICANSVTESINLLVQPSAQPAGDAK